MTKSNIGNNNKGLFPITVPHYSLSSRDIMAGTEAETREEPAFLHNPVSPT